MKVKCNIIHIRKIQEFMPMIELLLQNEFSILERTKEDMSEFIVENLYYLECDRFS